jgi:hypothetical protein
VQSIITQYREFAPCEALRPYVRSLFSFARASEECSPARQTIYEAAFASGDPFCAPLFADGHASMVFNLGMIFHADGSWRRSQAEPKGILIGPITRVDPACGGDLPALVGVYLRAGKASALVQVSAPALKDRILPLGEIWGAGGDQLAFDLDSMNEGKRLDHLEAFLLRRVGGLTRQLIWPAWRRGSIIGGAV